MLVRQEKIPSSVLRPSLLSTAVYVVQYLIFTGIYLVGMLWGDIQGGPSQRWIRDALRNKNTFTIFGWSSIITFSLSHGGKKKFFLKIQFSTRIILHLDKPLSNNWTMPLSDAWYYADDKVLDISIWIAIRVRFTPKGRRIICVWKKAAALCIIVCCCASFPVLKRWFLRIIVAMCLNIPDTLWKN